MTGSRPPRIWLADAVRAIDRLDADPATAARVAALLGTRTTAADSTTTVNPAPALLVAPAAVADAPFPVARTRPVTARDLVPAPSTETVPEPPRVVASVPPPSAAAPPRDLPSVSALLETPAVVPPVPTDLLDPRHQRALLSAVSSGLAPTEEVDADAAVDLLASGRPADPLPRRRRPTTRRGLEVLVDHGDAMTPLAADQAAVLPVVAHIVGPDGLRVLRFATTPLDEPGAGPGPLWRWRPYRPQPAGVPVLALTDLGLLGPPPGRPAVQARWIRFATMLREAGCPFVALVPVPEPRIPAALRRAVSIVVWDRPTRVRDAVTAVRRAGGRHR